MNHFVLDVALDCYFGGALPYTISMLYVAADIMNLVVVYYMLCPGPILTEKHCQDRSSPEASGMLRPQPV